MKKNILIVGDPHVGKSTLLKRIIADIPPEKKCGFVTNEVTDDGRRIGFEIETSFGEKKLFASHDLYSRAAVRHHLYGVDIEAFEVLSEKVHSRWRRGMLLYLDEVGEMQLHSEKWRDTFLLPCLGYRPMTCLATISSAPRSFLHELRRHRDDVILIELTKDNREAQYAFIAALLGKIEKAKHYIAHPELWSLFTATNSARLESEHGVRYLELRRGYDYGCNCDFYKQHKICSHMIAAEHMMQQKQNA